MGMSHVTHATEKLPDSSTGMAAATHLHQGKLPPAPLLLYRVAGGAGAYPSCHRARGGVHPVQVASPSQGLTRLRPIWSTPKIDLATKIRLLNSIIIPTAIYASETWKTSARIARRLNVAQQRWLRQILGVSYRDHVTNEEVHRRTATRPLQDIVSERRVRFGHTATTAAATTAHSPYRLPKIAITWNPPHGKRKPGCPRTTWRRTFIDNLRAIDIAWDEAEAAAADRVTAVIHGGEENRWPNVAMLDEPFGSYETVVKGD
ncbi:uncharacterized protein LOC143414974 [Maylandia zebra]|uniref:uncharacterized protein LOC143414974 n=1 Tax=Maylandia zebra TaxID=106582 RepID=UPI00403C1632